MILAAGLGTRLRPLTNYLPKALIEVNGMPMIGIIIQRLKYYGFREIVINLHYLSEKIISYLEDQKYFGVDIYFALEKDKLLDTGGGIKNARKFLDDGRPFLVHNVDVISDIDLHNMYKYHQSQHALATLAVKGKNSDRSLLFNNNWVLSGWENKNTGESKIIRGTGIEKYHRIGFCGIHAISSAIFDLMQKEKVFSIINTYMNFASTNKIMGYPVEKNLWMDIGSHDQLVEANKLDPHIYLV